MAIRRDLLLDGHEQPSQTGGYFPVYAARACKAVLERAAEIIVADGVARLLDLLVDESGSTLTKARAEIAYMPDLLRADAGAVCNDVSTAFSAARQIKAESVPVAIHPSQSNAMAPSGGFGDSGIKRSGGRYSIEEFTELKWIRLGAPP